MFEQRLKEQRTINNLTQEELSKKLDITPAAVGLYEQGRRKPDYELLIKLANIFCVSIDYLLGLTDDKNVLLPRPDDEYTILIQKAKDAKISPQKLNQLIDILKKEE